MPSQIRVLARRGGFLLTAFVLIDGLATRAGPQETFARAAVVRVNAQDCAGEIKARVGTGFVWRSSTEVVTALHVVAGCARVQVYSEHDRVSYPVTGILRALKRADLILMKLGDNASLPPLRTLATRPNTADNLTAWGYGEATPSMRSFTMRVAYGGRTLRENVPSHAADAIGKAGTPSLDVDVVPIQDAIPAGLSGAPLVDTSGRIRAIADGGVEHGITRVAWAIPVEYLSELANSTEPVSGYVALNAHLSAAEGSRAAVYAADYVALDAQTVKCGSAELTKMRTMQMWDVVPTADAPARAVAILNWLKGIDEGAAKTGIGVRDRYLVDVWEDRKSGAAVAVPRGKELTNQGNFCTTGGRDGAMVVQVTPVPALTDPDTVAEQFERLVMTRYGLNWVADGDSPKFLRPDGLVLKHKTFQGAEYSKSPTGTIVETLVTRNGTFLGVAAVRNTACSTERLGVRCPPADIMAWVPIAASVEVATFGISASRQRGLVEWQKK